MKRLEAKLIMIGGTVIFLKNIDQFIVYLIIIAAARIHARSRNIPPPAGRDGGIGAVLPAIIRNPDPQKPLALAAITVNFAPNRPMGGALSPIMRNYFRPQS